MAKHRVSVSCVSILVAFLIAGPVFAGPKSKKKHKSPPSNKQRYERMVKAARAKKLDSIRNAMRSKEIELKKARADLKRYKRKSRGSKRVLKMVKSLKAECRDLENRIYRVKKGGLKLDVKLWLDLKRLNLWQIGNISGYTEVSQIIGPKEMLVSYMWEHVGRGTIDGRVIVPFHRTLEATILVRGIKTYGHASKQKIDFDGLFMVTDTYTYKTAIGGSNTVFVLERFDIDG